MDQNYAIPRRIWRILYPPLIFIGIQFVVLGIASVAYGMFYAMKEAADSIVIQDAGMIVEEALQFLTGHSMLILLISDVICFAVLFPIWRKTRERLDSFTNNNPIVVCILTIGLFAAFNIIQMIIFSLTNVMEYFPSYREVTEVIITDSFAVQLLSIGIAAPMVEELLFRAILINRMKWLPIWASILIQSVLFGAAHMNLFQGLYAFIAGILLGLIYVKYRSLPIVIAGHVAYNIASLLMSEFASETAAGMAVVLSIFVLPVCAIMTIKHKRAIRQSFEYDTIPQPDYTPANLRTGYYPTGQWTASPPADPRSGYYPAGQWTAGPPVNPQSGYGPTDQKPISPPLDPWSGYHQKDPWLNNDKTPRQ